jgi:hypothetical protein
MQQALRHVIHDCEHVPGAPRCPIIEAIDPGPTGETPAPGRPRT